MRVPAIRTSGFALAIACLQTASAAHQPVPPLDDAAMEQFLARGRIVATRRIGTGVTDSVRASLTDGPLTHDAQIQTIDQFRQEFRSPKGVERDFRDNWGYNIAAYRIDRLIDLRMVPVSVERRWNSKSAAFTWWVEDVLMDEGARSKKGIQPPRPACWLEQMRLLDVFDELIENTDRNTGNILITKSWRVVAIDHTRAFRRSRIPPNLASLTRIDRTVLAGLAALDFPGVKRETRKYLDDAQIRSLLSRRDAIVAHFKELPEWAVFDRQDFSAACRGD